MVQTNTEGIHLWSLRAQGLYPQFIVSKVPAQAPITKENPYSWDPYSFSGLEKRTSAVTNEVVEEFNEQHGTDKKPVFMR